MTAYSRVVGKPHKNINSPSALLHLLLKQEISHLRSHVPATSKLRAPEYLFLLHSSLGWLGWGVGGRPPPLPSRTQRIHEVAPELLCYPVIRCFITTQCRRACVVLSGNIVDIDCRKSEHIGRTGRVCVLTGMGDDSRLFSRRNSSTS